MGVSMETMETPPLHASIYDFFKCKITSTHVSSPHGGHLLWKVLDVSATNFNLLQLDEFDDFFDSDGRRALLFYYQPPTEKEEDGRLGATTPAYNANGRRLFITDGKYDEYTGTCLFFVRINPSKPITVMNIHQVGMRASRCMWGKSNPQPLN